MCLLVCIRSEDGSLVLAANRDERYDRPSRAPFLWDLRPRLLAGRDESAGGTWLAVNEHGLVAAVTNRPSEGGHEPHRPSRGTLPPLACAQASAAAARTSLESHLQFARYNGFNLFIGGRDGAFVAQAPGPGGRFEAVLPGIHVVANGAWDEPCDPRVARAKAILTTGWTTPGRLDVPRRMSLLMDICRDHLRLTDASALCLHGRQAGTVSSTILALSPTGVLLRYLHADGPPCRTEYADLAGLLRTA